MGERTTTVKYHHASEEDDKEWILIQQGNWSIRIPIVMEELVPKGPSPSPATPTEWSIRKVTTSSWSDLMEDHLGELNNGSEKSGDGKMMNPNPKESGKEDAKRREATDKINYFDESLWGPVADQDSIMNYWGFPSPKSLDFTRKAPKKNDENEELSKEGDVDAPNEADEKEEFVEVGGKNGTTTENPEDDEQRRRKRFRPSLWSMPDQYYEHV